MKKILSYICYKIHKLIKAQYASYVQSKLGGCGKGAYIQCPFSCSHPEIIFLDDGAHLFEGFNFISNGGKFYMGKNSGTGIGLTVITNSHKRVFGSFRIKNSSEDFEQDIVVEEDVLIGAYVTLMDGCRIGRGATVGACSVVRNNVPPYSIVIGNPAKVVGFSFTPEQIIEHEKTLYHESQRLPLDLLEKNYEKYFIKRMKDIRSFMS